jgi:hypothetical protein
MTESLADRMATLDNGMVVHTRARALVAWLVPQVATWPRAHRHTITQHTCALAMRVHDALVAARHLDAQCRGDALRDADMALDQLRQYLQLAWHWHWLSDGQYQHVSALTDEVGRLVGGWRRSLAPGARQKEAAPG